MSTATSVGLQFSPETNDRRSRWNETVLKLVRSSSLRSLVADAQDTRVQLVDQRFALSGVELTDTSSDARLSPDSFGAEDFGGFEGTAVDVTDAQAFELLGQASLTPKLTAVFRDFEGQSFEDGMESRFSQAVSDVVRHGESAIRIIESLILSQRVAPELAGEALRWLPRAASPESHELLRGIIENCLLQHPSYLVRDGAIAALGLLMDRRSAEAVRTAILREPYAELRTDLEQLLEDLESLD